MHFTDKSLSAAGCDPILAFSKNALASDAFIDVNHPNSETRAAVRL